MDTNPTPTNTQYQPVTVQVPEDRIAEFHAFFGRFLAGPMGRGRRGRHGRPHRGHNGPHGRGCAGRRNAEQASEASGQAAGTTEV
jgi:hypothetical protein